MNITRMFIKNKMLIAEAENKIKLAVDADRKPVRCKNGNFLLRFGTGFKYLIKGDKVTDAGLYWAEITGESLPTEGFDKNPNPVRRARSEYITMSDGTERLVRSFDAVRNKHKYSKLGLKFFAEHTSEWIASIPLQIKGKRPNGTTYTIESMFPVESFGIGKVVTNRNLTEEQRVSKIKSEVLKHFANHAYKDGKLVLHEFSDEIGHYDRDSSWALSELRTTDGGDNMDAILNRPLAKRPRIYPSIPCPLDVLDAALECHDDIYCVVRQLACSLHLDWAKVADEFEKMCPGWRERGGISANEILKYAEIHNYTCFVFWQSRCITKRQNRYIKCVA